MKCLIAMGLMFLGSLVYAEPEKGKVFYMSPGKCAVQIYKNKSYPNQGHITSRSIEGIDCEANNISYPVTVSGKNGEIIKSIKGNGDSLLH